jgi:carbamoylphosphate synthase large subunit
VSRSSALAPKATGFHRKDALAFVSVRPDEIPNDITARRRQASSPRSTTS